jgi:hypothetical protein
MLRGIKNISHHYASNIIHKFTTWIQQENVISSRIPCGWIYWADKSGSAHHEITFIVWELKIHCRADMCPHSTLCFARWIQSTSLLSTSFILKQKIMSHRCPGLKSCRFPLYFQTKSLHPHLTHLMHVTCLLHTLNFAGFHINNPHFNGINAK